ncbi:MAG: methyltransferase domain-containing protein, partial [Candidatus Thorarchaeota archaeon]
MAVAFMAALEREPETYDQAFDKVLDGRASQIRERILELVKPGMKVLDLGCGPGLFVIEASMKGAAVVGIDANEEMIHTARVKVKEMNNPPDFIHQDVLQVGEDIDKQLDPSERFDLIVSTFLLSELKPSRRDLFMKIVRGLLKENGVFAIASETLPKKRADEKRFWTNRRDAEKQAGKRLPPPVIDLTQLVQIAGLEIDTIESYGSEITFVVGTNGSQEVPNPYTNLDRPYTGIGARSRIWYNHLTGSWRGMPVQPGLFKIGNPSPDSPVIVTANYELTYYTVMRALAKDNIEAWVLVCDTDGINVWCAARGIHFNSDDVIHMIRMTELQRIVNHRELILPQLAAAGMDTTEIRERTGFRVKYGPVRIQDLSKWMNLEKPRPKPREMASVTFNLKERLEMTVAHVPFLFAAILWKPFAALVVGLLGINAFLFFLLPAIFSLLLPTSLSVSLLVLQFLLSLLGNALVLGLIFPVLPSKDNSFIRRGIGFALITMP